MESVAAVERVHTRDEVYQVERLPDRIADAVTGFVGSWAFVLLHAAWFVLWVALRVEPFPYGLLTMLVSLEAIFLSTFVMLSQNRSAARDHVRDDHEAEEVDLLFKINQQQLEILRALHLRQSVLPDRGPDGRFRKRVG